jgi:hypothetical protein
MPGWADPALSVAEDPATRRHRGRRFLAGPKPCLEQDDLNELMVQPAQPFVQVRSTQTD